MITPDVEEVASTAAKLAIYQKRTAATKFQGKFIGNSTILF